MRSKEFQNGRSACGGISEEMGKERSLDGEYYRAKENDGGSYEDIHTTSIIQPIKSDWKTGIHVAKC